MLDCLKDQNLKYFLQNEIYDQSCQVLTNEDDYNTNDDNSNSNYNENNDDSNNGNSENKNIDNGNMNFCNN